MQRNIQARGVNTKRMSLTSRRSYYMMKSLMLCIKINDYIYKDTEYKYFEC